jgi:hypothetical protein
MGEPYTFSPRLRNVTFTLIFLGIVTASIGFYIDASKTWANYLLNNYYFTMLSIGAMFFLSIQYITRSGWSALFTRIPHAIGYYLPVAGVLMLFLIFGMQWLYPWSHSGAAIEDPLIAHKAPYLNIPFFFIRMIIYFGLWIFMTLLLRKMAFKEDLQSGLHYYYKSEFYCKVFIFIMALSTTLATFDLIMSIDVHWYSTIFAVKNFISGFYHAVAVIILIILFLNHKGLFPQLNNHHLHDFSKYLFILSLIWAYLWFVQYLLIWFTNIPEETIYFVTRIEGKWKVFFYLNIILNWFIPFFLLLPNKTDSSKLVMGVACIVSMIGMWVDFYLQIMPGSTGEFGIGFIEVGMFAGFAGLFGLVIAWGLNRIPLVPQNHPYLKESINH